MYSFTSGLLQFLSFQGEDVGSEATQSNSEFRCDDLIMSDLNIISKDYKKLISNKKNML